MEGQRQLLAILRSNNMTVDNSQRLHALAYAFNIGCNVRSS